MATVTDLAGGTSDGPHPLQASGDAAHALELPPRSPGEYRLTVEGANRSGKLVQPVTGVFMVAPDEPPGDD